jgi:hypothetical protein
MASRQVMEVTAASGWAIKMIVASGHSVRMGNEDDRSIRTVMKMMAASGQAMKTMVMSQCCVRTRNEDDSSVKMQHQDRQ